jgi:plastocyanin
MPPSESTQVQPDMNETPSPVNQQPATPSTNNRVMVIIGLILLLLVVCVGAYYAFHSSNKTTNVTSMKKIVPAQVSITSTGFVPASISVNVGQAVTWTNNDSSPHIVASDPYPTDNALAGFNAKQNMSRNDSFSFVFNKVGTYTYHDNLNPYAIKGTVIVKQ